MATSSPTPAPLARVCRVPSFANIFHFNPAIALNHIDIIILTTPLPFAFCPLVLLYVLEMEGWC